ncbi:MAG: alpha/beta fold hydrolase [Thermoleophilaceae bacterium]
MILLSGWSASGLAWPRSWIRDLQRSFRVIRIDNRGSGWSRYAELPFTMADLAGDVVDVMDDAQVPSATLFGLSMGGMIAQEIAMTARERVTGLVLAATAPPTPGFKPRTGSALAVALVRPPLYREPLDQYFRKLWTMATAEGFAERRPDVIEELVQQILERPTPRSLLMHQLRAVIGWGHASRLARITVPTVVVHGTEDSFMDIRAGRRLAELVPGARFVELEGVGHLVAHEAPEIATQLIREVSEPAAAAVSSA